jgi:hypothetical protein
LLGCGGCLNCRAAEIGSRRRQSRAHSGGTRDSNRGTNGGIGATGNDSGAGN